MHVTLLTVAIAAVGVSAIAAPGPQITQAPALHARAFDQLNKRYIKPGLSSPNEKERDCLTYSYTPLALGVPFPSGQLLSWMAVSLPPGVKATITDVGQVQSYCSESVNVTPPASLSSAFSAWKSEVTEWQKDIRDEAHSMSKECGAVGPYFDLAVATDEAECNKAASAMFAAAAPTSTSKGAGPRETGLMAAAAAVAGVAGVLAAM